MSEQRNEIFTGWNLLYQVRQEKPLIHCITNYVTANDTANMILAMGASPIMADAGQEVEEITALSKGLVLNIGTLNEAKADAMLAAGKKAASLGRPVILDPVGAGASRFRTETARRLIKEIPCTVIRGNASEIRTLAGEGAYSHGVDADIRDRVNDMDIAGTIELLKQLSKNTGAVIVMTGERDIIADGEQACRLFNGHRMMAGITGTGCMMDGIIAAFQAAEVSDPSPAYPCSFFWRTVYAAAAAGICGELAYEKMTAAGGGSGSFRMYYIDAMSHLKDEDIRGGVRLEL